MTNSNSEPEYPMLTFSAPKRNFPNGDCAVAESDGERFHNEFTHMPLRVALSAPRMLAAIKTALHSIEQARRTVDGSQPADLPGCLAALDWIADDLKHSIRRACGWIN